MICQREAVVVKVMIRQILVMLRKVLPVRGPDNRKIVHTTCLVQTLREDPH